MPDTRKHRGLHPHDPVAFCPAARPSLCAATEELSWLLGRGYAPLSSLKLVGDRHALSGRQRAAVSRCACAPERARLRQARMVTPDAVRDRPLWVDGFNILTTLEVALSGGIVLVGRDGAARDIAGVHGSYRRVEETVPALTILADVVRELGAASCLLLLDRPVSNSGRLAALINEHARRGGWPLAAEVVADPDPVLSRCNDIVASADGDILDRCTAWLNLAYMSIDRRVPTANLVDLSHERP